MMTINKLTKMTIIVHLLLASIAVEGKEIIKIVCLENIQINYYFNDQESLQKEAEISQLIDQAYSVYSSLFQGRPLDLLGQEYSEISIHVRKARNMGGEADPKLIMLSWNDDKLFGFASWQTMLLHELFHLWNAESFRYQNGQEHWFNEGFTEYYAYKTAVQLELISLSEMLAIAALPIGYYSSSHGIGKVSMRDAGETNKSKFENYFLIYHGGWLVAMILDYDIRKKTHGTKSLNDLMLWMYNNFPRKSKLYSVNDIVKGLKLTTNINYNDFFDRYINGKERIPVSDYLPIGDALWALEFKMHRRKEYKLLYETLGFKADFN